MAVAIEPGIDRATLAARVGELCRLTGDFTLRSGQVASTYIDKYLFEADPELLSAIAAHMAKLMPDTTEVVAGLELGGVPVATAIALATGIPAAFVRKETKTYGTAKLVEGADVAGRHVLIIEDAITTGGQAAASTSSLAPLTGPTWSRSSSTASRWRPGSGVPPTGTCSSRNEGAGRR